MRSLERKVEPPISFKEDVSLAPYSTWRVGGTARWLVEPGVEELPDLMSWAHQQSICVYFIGRGSNILVADAGLPGLVIVTRNSMTSLKRERSLIAADSGVFLPHLSRFAAQEGFSGFEFLIGIPGTVGGALAMNSGLTVFRPREMVSIVESFDVIDLDGSTHTMTMADVNVDYRKTDLLDCKRFVSRVRFRLKDEDNPKKILSNTLEHLTERKRKQPLDKPTAGSTFKSLPGSKSAGWYIEQAGLKGFELGGAKVSLVHANWIENLGHATAADIRNLMNHIQMTVKERMGVSLEPEIRYLS